MSRAYIARIEISEFDKQKEEDIQQACQQLWNGWRNWNSCKIGDQVILCSEGYGYLVGGESEEEFVTRLQYAVWKTNKGYCKITVGMHYLEDWEMYTSDYETFKKMTSQVVK